MYVGRKDEKWACMVSHPLYLPTSLPNLPDACSCMRNYIGRLSYFGSDKLNLSIKISSRFNAFRDFISTTPFITIYWSVNVSKGGGESVDQEGPEGYENESAYLHGDKRWA